MQLNLKLKIQFKILVLVLSVTVVIFVVVIGIIGLYSKNQANSSNIAYIDSQAEAAANFIANKINEDLSAAETLSRSIKAIDNLNDSNRFQLQAQILQNILQSKTSIISAWVSWELSALNSEYTKNYGRIRYLYHIDDNGVHESIDSLDLTGDNLTGLYYKIKISEKNAITDPYYFSYENSAKEEEQILETSVCAPIIDGTNFVGLVGFDIEINYLQSITDKIKPFEGAQAFLISNSGVLVTFPDKEFVNKHISAVFHSDTLVERLLQVTSVGGNYQTFWKNDNLLNFITLRPIEFTKTDTPWSVCIVVPVKDLNAVSQKGLWLSIMLGAVGIGILSIIIILLSKFLTNPLVRINNYLKTLDMENMNGLKIISDSMHDEVGEIAFSTYNLISWLHKTSEFANKIGEGDLNAEYELLHSSDKLGKSLLELRNRLKIAKELEQKNAEESRRRAWANEGLASFTSILQNEGNLKEFTTRVIKKLVKFLEINQGGVFVVQTYEKGGRYLELMAAFGYDRIRKMNKLLDIDEGITGRAIAAKETVYMTEIPEGYLEIKSGLGGAAPSFLLVVPLIVNNDVYGVIELASFYEIEDYKIKFVEKLGENIASSIMNLQINYKTNLLLTNSKEYSEQLLAQEEELKQSIEEMEATREETERREKNLMHEKEKAVKEMEYWKEIAQRYGAM